MSSVVLLRHLRHPTIEEEVLCLALRRRGVNVHMQWFDGHKHVDLMLPEGRIDVEVDGMQHLTNPKQIVADLDRGHFTHKQRGYDTIHIPNQFLYAHLDEIAHGLAEAVRLRRERVQRPVPIIVKTA